MTWLNTEADQHEHRDQVGFQPPGEEQNERDSQDDGD
jgi:hypothetical protein